MVATRLYNNAAPAAASQAEISIHECIKFSLMI